MIKLPPQLGVGCPRCECACGAFYTCKNSACKNYCPPIIGKGGRATRPAETILSDTISLYGRWSDSQKRYTKYNSSASLIGETAKIRLIPSPKLKYAACWTGEIEYKPSGKQDEVIITAISGPIEVTYYDCIGSNWLKLKAKAIFK
jgi:hypothetical protein